MDKRKQYITGLFKLNFENYSLLALMVVILHVIMLIGIISYKDKNLPFKFSLTTSLSNCSFYVFLLRILNNITTNRLYKTSVSMTNDMTNLQ